MPAIQYPSYVMLAAGLPARYAMHVGRTHLARRLFMVPLCIGVIVVPLFTNGVRTPVIANMPMLVLLAGWMLGRRTMKILAALFALSVALLWLAEAEGWFVLSVPLRSPDVWSMVWVSITILTGIIVWSLVGNYEANFGQERELRLQLAEALGRAEAANRELIETLDFNETIILNSPLPMGVYAASGQCILANDAYAQLVGASREALQAQNFHTIDTWQKSGPLDDCLAALAHHAPQRREVHLVSSFGKEIWVEYSILPTHLKGEQHLLIQFFDLTERKLNQQRMEHLILEQKAILENELVGIETVKNRTIVWANPAFERMLGYAPGELAGTATRQHYPNEEAYLAFGAAAYPILSAGNTFRSQIEHLRKDGSHIWVDVSGAMLDPATGETLWCFIDVTERRHLEQSIAQSEQRMELALAGAGLGLWDLDIPNGSFTNNQRLVTMLGYTPGEIEMNAKTLVPLLHPDDGPKFGAVFYAHLKGETSSFEAECRVRHKDGHWIWILSRGKVVERDENGRAVRMTGTNLDISERKANEAKIHDLAFYDALTHLSNRRLLLDRLGLALPASARRNTYGAVLFLDLDNFKILNDTKGHEFGDLLLTQVAQRLLSCVRVEDTVARFGGDEFVVMVEDLSQEAEQAAAQVESIGEKIRGALGVEYSLQEHSHHCSCSIGISLFKGTEATVGELIKRADIAMYQAKSAGRNTIRLFQSGCRV